ncbi:HAD family hydrolase [Clostridium sp. LP20]|uniref:HAD family hydrolase n=1 Tax=Clostridium sp. LP20 TaxID=3418665 RepID=UPI003EE4A927
MTLYVSDLDGTLLNNNAEISATSKELLNKALNNNVQFTIATARTPATVVNILKDVNINMPVVTMNGSAIYDIKKDNYLRYTTIDLKFVKTIDALIKKENLNAFIYTIKNNHLFVYHRRLKHPYQIKFYNQRKNSSFKTFIQEDFPSDAEVLYFTIMEYKDKINSLYNKIKAMKDLYIVKYKDNYDNDIYYLEIYSVKSSKANAIKYLKQHYDFNKLVTFGDNLNDIPMFEISDECYAVKNAVDELKEIATGVIGLNTEDSVAKFIRN